jgi:hypothetical protein
MHLQTLATLLPKIRTNDCVVRFTDGDSYLIGSLDILGYIEDDGTFEIVVEFQDCLGESATKTKASASRRRGSSLNLGKT